MSDESTSYKPRCINLYSKSMAIYGEDFQSSPEFQQGCDDFTCQCTGKYTGPDGMAVTLEDCSNCQRGCFQEY